MIRTSPSIQFGTQYSTSFDHAAVSPDSEPSVNTTIPPHPYILVGKPGVIVRRILGATPVIAMWSSSLQLEGGSQHPESQQLNQDAVICC